jgi:hypothetical protein
MNFSTPSETILREAFAEEAERYGEILKLAEELSTAFREGDTGASRLGRIQKGLEEVAAIEARIAPTKRAWEESGRQPGPELEEEMSRLRKLLTRLVERIRTAEEEVAARMSRMEPELETIARGRKMRRAYGS